jgi:hypothetical protein
MGGSDFRRAEYSRFNSVTHSPKILAYVREHGVEEIGDVLEET